MKIILDCEFTQLNASSKLISLALVAEDGRELYVELTDSYIISDCSDFVIEHVLPQLDLEACGCTVAEAKTMLAQFIGGFGEVVQICSDAPDWDWEFFCEMMYVDGKWPGNVRNQPGNLIQMLNEKIQDDGQDLEDQPELPHHALLDARQLAHIYRSVIA